jgi:hypothetical protein
MMAMAVPYGGAFLPDLAAFVYAWDRLPEAVKAGIVAMVKAAITR